MNDMEWGKADGLEGPFVADGPGVSGAPEATRPKVDLTPTGVTLEESIAVAERLFFSYVKDLECHKEALEAVKSGAVDPAALKQAVHAASGVREAIHILMTERNKVDKLRKDIGGALGGGSLDLDGARDEIGRRLACLRRAAGG